MRSLLLGALALAALAACKDKKAEWVAPQTLQQAPVRAVGLTPVQLDRIKKLQRTFAEVDSMPLEMWVEDFSRDHNPDREIEIYEGMAEAYLAYCSGRELSQAAKSEVYSVVLLRSGAPDAEVLSRVKRVALTLDDVKEILRGYKLAPAPITVSPVSP